MLRDIHFCYLHLRVISLGSRASKKYAAETRALDFGRHCCIAGKGQWDIQFVFSARDNTGIASELLFGVILRLLIVAPHVSIV